MQQCCLDLGTHFEPAAGLGQWQSGATCGAPTDWQTISFVFHSWFSFISILGFQKKRCLKRRAESSNIEKHNYKERWLRTIEAECGYGCVCVFFFNSKHRSICSSQLMSIFDSMPSCGPPRWWRLPECLWATAACPWVECPWAEIPMA